MKTVKPVSKETLDRIGTAYAICSEYPDVFGDVTMRKFCGMFVDDIIDEGEDEHEARMKAYAGEMYEMLELAIDSLYEHNANSPTAKYIEALLDRIDGKEDIDDE